MIENIIIRKQTPTDGMWLYRFDEQSNTYIISKQVYLGKSDIEWEECTEEEKMTFESHNAKVQEELEKTLEQ
jgi:hypothetical protein